MRKAKINLQKIEAQNMKKQKRKKHLLIAAGILVLVACLVLVGIFFYKKHQEKQRVQQLRTHFVNYEACSTDLNALVNYLILMYPDTEKRPEYLLVASGDLVDSSGTPIMMPKKLNDSVKNIAKNGFFSNMFKWRLVAFDGNRIQFDTNDGNYALVYAPDGQPTYLHEADDDFDILVEHIEGHWYHVLRIN